MHVTFQTVMASAALICDSEPWKDLKEHVNAIEKTHLRDLMNDVERCQSLMIEIDGIHLDYSRQRVRLDTMEKLLKLAEVAAQLKQKIGRMYNGDHINSTENRSVLHIALRAPRDKVICSDGKNVVPDVWYVLDKIKEFSERVRSGSWVGATGKALKDVVAIGIGGSFLGPLFVHTALQTDPEAADCARGRQLRFLANVDPVDVARSISGLNPETTLVVVVSKTFTTAETMLNARTMREWISSALGTQAVAKHMVAVSTNLMCCSFPVVEMRAEEQSNGLVEKFGIDPANTFAFWDWVGGRYSGDPNAVCSAVGVLPLSLQYGFPIVEKFLNGASNIDNHFYSGSFERNLPVLLGLLSVWNVTFLGYPARAILPYSQALEKFAPHIQQVSMESNGKGVSIDGIPLPFETGEIDFGEPGTNGQHSFYQLIHQGRVVPCDFIGSIKSQQPIYLKGEVVSNHDELMSNFFAQPDALAYGKSPEQLLEDNVPDHLVPHKTFSGNRPSLSLLLPSLDAYNIGKLLAIYEHRIAVEGFIWGINSFDQWGVELGKVLASQVRKQLHLSRTKREPVQGFNFSATTLLTRYLEVHLRAATPPRLPSPHLSTVLTGLLVLLLLLFLVSPFGALSASLLPLSPNTRSVASLPLLFSHRILLSEEFLIFGYWVWLMSFSELKDRHVAATAMVNTLRDRLNQKRQQLLDTDVAGYAKSQGRTAVNFSSTDLVCCRTLQGHTGKVYSLDWTPEKNRIVSASQDGRLIIWNALTSQKTHAIKLPCAWVMTCSFAPNGYSVACGGLDSECSIFNLNSQVDRDGNLPVSRVLTGHKGYVSSCEFVRDQDTRLITGSGDQTCVLWDVTTGQRISVFGGEFPSGHTSDVLSISINSSNSNMFVSGSCDATARLWDTRIASRAIRTYHGHHGDVNTVKFFPDGQRFGTGSDDGTCRLFDMRTGHQLQVYSQQQANNDQDVPIVTSIAFSISGRLLFAGYSNGDCYVWDTLLAEVRIIQLVH
ncbi:guanine nucleotide-binding protein subunit [Musa troglodytarum]|uniref:Glucose-6-phosphate isomerase n=2 Tax=Musa troglodytarum TaxID=320322 RepID=A0A9E7LF94_9LILI|nr:guanine nucleotide-binding protein subunit [Musa troglodytarum]